MTPDLMPPPDGRLTSSVSPVERTLPARQSDETALSRRADRRPPRAGAGAAAGAAAGAVEKGISYAQSTRWPTVDPGARASGGSKRTAVGASSHSPR